MGRRRVLGGVRLTGGMRRESAAPMRWDYCPPPPHLRKRLQYSEALAPAAEGRGSAGASFQPQRRSNVRGAAKVVIRRVSFATAATMALIGTSSTEMLLNALTTRRAFSPGRRSRVTE